MKRLILLTAGAIFLFSCKKDSKPSISETELDTLKVKKEQSESINVNEPIKKTIKETKEALRAKGFDTFDYIDEVTNDTILMQQYFIVFLKSGPIRSQNEEDSKLMQNEHVAYLNKMNELGYADISGSFGDKGDIRGVTIYNVPTLKMADSLAKSDPMVKNGRLVVEVHPWWVAKGHSFR